MLMWPCILRHSSLTQDVITEQVKYVGLISNLGGVTGLLLSLDGGQTARKLRLDVLYPISGFKRCLDSQNGFGEPPYALHAACKQTDDLHGQALCTSSCVPDINMCTSIMRTMLWHFRPGLRCLKAAHADFLYPSSWLADQRLAYRKAQRQERLNPLDMPSARRWGQTNCPLPPCNT